MDDVEERGSSRLYNKQQPVAVRMAKNRLPFEFVLIRLRGQLKLGLGVASIVSTMALEYQSSSGIRQRRALRRTLDIRHNQLPIKIWIHVRSVFFFFFKCFVFGFQVEYFRARSTRQLNFLKVYDDYDECCLAG